MPTWRTSLPPEGAHRGYDLKRTPQTGALEGIITCEQLIVCDTHYWHGRTLPCERTVNADGKTLDDSACRACQEKQSWRTHAYVSAYNGRSHEHFLFECTAQAAKPLQEYYDKSGTLRGCIFHAQRPKGGRNSKVMLATNSANLTRVQLPPSPNVPAALAVIWRLPNSAIPVTEERPATKRVRADSRKLREMRQQQENAADPEPIADVIKDPRILQTGTTQ